MKVKLASNVDARRPITSANMPSNNNAEAGNNAVLSNSNQQDHENRLTVDNHALNETDIGDKMPLPTPTLINCNSKEGNNNNSILSNQQVMPVSSKRPTRIISVVDNKESWYTTIGLKETHHVTTDNSTDNRVKNNNTNNVSTNKQHCENGSLQNVTASGDGKTQNEAEYIQTNNHSFQSQMSLETDDQDCPSSAPCPMSLEKVYPKTKASTTVIDGSTNEVEAVLGCVESSHVSGFKERERFPVQEESEKDSAQSMGSLIDSDSLITNNTAKIKVNLENSKTLPDYLKTLVEGKSVCGDTYVSFSKPDWFDVEKFERGQRFAINHIFGVMFAELMSLMILFAFRGGLEPLIFTGKSDTPFKAFKRYLSTITRVKSWYEGDIWDVDSVAHKNLKVVRGMHDAVRKSMESAPPQEVVKRVTLESGKDSKPIWTDLHEEILDDFRSSCPFSGSSMANQKKVHINQFDMAMTQFGFLGLIVVFPKMFGVHYASDDDFEGFAHFWRTIGYLLGTEDRFNLCTGDLKTVRQRCLDMIDHWMRPKFRELSRDWIHMSRCVFKGVSFYVLGVKFEILLLYLCRVLDIKAVKLAASLTFWEYCLYLETIFLYWFTFRLPGMWRLHNWLINLSVKRAQNFSPERLTKLEQRVHSYETSSNTTSTRL